LSLRNLAIQDDYRSDGSDLIREFYIPCLENSTVYKRAVGFFSSTSMAVVAKGLTALIRTGGKMQLVASPCLSQEDAEAIATGLRQREEVIANAIVRELDQEFEQIVRDRLACLAWLLGQGVLEIKLAVASNIRSQGIYREKLGIFADAADNIVAFTGSANESSTALIDNFECIDVFCSWNPGVRERALRKAENFQRLWDNDTSNVEVIGFPEAAARSLLRLLPKQQPEWEPGLLFKLKRLSVSESKGSYNVNSSKENDPLRNENETLRIPSEIALRQHQRKALREWFANSGKGILEMATGSGKTITALAAATRLYEYIGSPLLIVIICPYLHLISQWIEEAGRFGLNPLVCAVSRDRWQQELSVRIYNSTTGIRRLSSIITSNATFSSELFQHQIHRVSCPFLLIVDEVHNLGAEQLRNCLPKNASYRLGLSATPERWFDATGTQALTNYFGSTLVHYTLREALQDGVLCPYRYHPQLVELTDNEFDLYDELTVKIARVLGQNNDALEEATTGLEALLIQRSRLIATAQRKLEALQSLLTPLRHSTHNLIYCGDGTVETEFEQSLERQIDAVTRLLGRDLGMTVAKYTAETPLSRREELRRQFSQGEIQCLIAIRCLDEGVDIPETRRAFILASSSNPRQFIQRRGRLLRTSPGKQMAEVFDFVVEPPTELTQPNSEYYALTRRLFGKELRRVIEFASLAVNGPEALHQLLDLRDRLNLLALSVEE
jgi:DNA phosphorothioation system restriction enzyme